MAKPKDNPNYKVVAENRREGRKYQVGDNVWVGLAVMRIPDLNAMKVVAKLSDVDDGRIARGMRANCTLDIDPDRTFAGTVTEIQAPESAVKILIIPTNEELEIANQTKEMIS